MAMVSSSSASVAVEKATSDLLINPDWTVNIDICDSINSSHWAAKDVVKAVKKRLQHKSPRVQLLTLTLLETMVKNCGDFVHFQIAEKNILGEMVKIVRKKTDMHVRDKILVLLDSWQEAFGGPGGKHPQYYWAYEELRRSGVEFPQRSLDTSPIFTPPANHPASRPAQAGYGMPINASRRLDETMASDIEGLSLSSLESMRNVMELLSDMLQAVSPDDREAVKDEIIIDLVNRCRSNQKMLMQMLTTTGDEELLSRGLELNDSLQVLLAKHDAIASGSPMPAQVTNTSPKPSNVVSDSKPAEESKDSNPTASTNVTAPVANVTRGHLDEEEEEDDFAMLARRHSKSQPGSSLSADGNNMALVPMDSNNTASSSSNVVQSNALALPDPPATVRTTKEQDMIEFLSLTLANTSTSPKSNPPSTPPANGQNVQQATISSATQGHVSNSYGYDGNQGQVPYTNYVVPWAQPRSQQQVQPSSQPQQQFQGQPQPQQQYHPQAQTQPQTQSQQQFQTQPQTQQQFYNQPQTQPQTQSQQQFQTQPQTQQQFYNQPQTQFQPLSQQHFQAQPQAQLHPQHQQQFHTHPQTQLQPQSHQQVQAQNQTQLQPQPHQQFQSQPQTQPRTLPQQQFQPQSQQQLQAHQQPQLTHQYPQYSSGYPPPPWAPTPNYANGKYVNANPNASYNAMHETRPSQHISFPRVSNGSSMNGDPLMSSGSRNVAPAAGQRTFIPSYRLFEDLNVLGSADGRFKSANGTSQSLSGSSGPSMVGGRK